MLPLFWLLQNLKIWNRKFKFS